MVKQIGIESDSIDTFLTQLTQTQTVTDAVLFANATEVFILQVPALQAVSDNIKRIASDTTTAPGIGGYMEQTVTFLAQAVVLIQN